MNAQASVESIFAGALEIDSAEDRGAYLDAICGTNRQVRARVEQLLVGHAKAGRFLESVVPGVSTTPIEPGPRVGIGSRIGPYRLLQQIGEGGMGAVYMAEQDHPVRRRVALKVIKAGMDSGQVIARFEAERQALAMMDHGNIARVLDAGATEGGQPYFVMELVPGVSITRYCDDNKLTPRQRLELFVPICQAIQHAHQKGILHRDIKPSNVLVTLYDGRPVAKVIDFGLAKAIEQRLTERTLFTNYGAIVGTLEYMSPEQAEASALGVDTRTDIYSLGVLLYELLTGNTPLSHKRVREAGYAEILRMIKEEEPPKPSTRLSESGETLPSISAQRHMESAKLIKLVRGELDWIVMKTLEKDRNRRYETASALAADVRRYLCDESVEACPPSAWYRFRKFARRNKRALATAALLGVMLLIALAALVVSNVLVTRERDQKQAALEQKAEAFEQERQALDEMYREKERADGNLEKANEAVKDYLIQTAENPRLKGADLHALRKDLLVTAVPYYEEFVKQKGDDPKLEVNRGVAYYALAYLRTEMGERKKALADYEQARTIFARLAAADLPTRPRDRQLLGYSHNALGTEFRDLGKRIKAEEAYGKALTLQKQLADEFPTSPYYRLELTGTHSNLGILFREGDDLAKAEVHDTEALTLRKKLAEEFPKLPQCRRDLARSHGNFALMLNTMGKREESKAHYRQALDLQEKLKKEFPGDPDYRHDLGLTHTNLGGLMRELNKPTEAEDHYLQAIELQQKLTEAFPSVPLYRDALAMTQVVLGLLLRAKDRPAEAEAAFNQALIIREKLVVDFDGVPAYRRELASSHTSLGLLLRDLDRRSLAGNAFQRAVDITGKLIDEFPFVPQYQSDLGIWLNNLALLRMDQGQLPEARRLLEDAITHKQAALKASPNRIQYRLSLRTACMHLGQLLERLGERAKAEAAYRRALEVLQESPTAFSSLPVAQSDIGATLNDLSMLLMARGEGLAEARRLLEQAVAHQQRALKPQPLHPTYRVFLRHHYANLAETLVRLGEHAEAARAAEKMVHVFPDSPTDFYRAACFLARCVPLAKKDPAQSPEGRNEIAETDAHRAVELLGDAIRKGWKDVEHIKSNPDFDPLRSRNDFKNLLTNLETNAREKHGGQR